MMHEAAIEAARQAMRRDDLDPTAEEVARCVATFLREVYVSGYRDGQERMRDLMRGTLTEEFAASQFPIEEPPT